MEGWRSWRKGKACSEFITRKKFFSVKKRKAKEREATNLRVKKQTKGKEYLLSERYFLVAVSINNVNYC